MSNPWSAPVIKPLSKLVEFFRIQLAGAPAERVEEAIAGIEEHVAEEIRVAVEPLKADLEALKGGAPVAAEGTDPFAEIREQIAALRARFDAIEIPPAPDLEALHKRLAAVEALAAKAAPRSRRRACCAPRHHRLTPHPQEPTMADSVPPSVVSLLKDIVGALVIQQAQIAELQGDRTTLVEANERLTAAVESLQSHAETVTGDTGLTSQLGDLSQVPMLQQQLAAAMPAPVEAAPVAAAQDAAIQAAA